MIVLMKKETYLTTNKLNTSLPSVFSSSLQKFKDFFLEEVLYRLSPIKRIEHQIDFILETPIPNKIVYKSNHEETKKLQRQVKELLAKGYVWENMSSCVVSMLLVPKKNKI